VELIKTIMSKKVTNKFLLQTLHSQQCQASTVVKLR